MVTALTPKLPIQRLIRRSLWIGALSTVSLLLGVVPHWQQSTGVSFDTAAQAQSQFSDQELQSFVQAAETLEVRRQQDINRIKDIIGSVPSIACDRPSSIRELPATEAQQIAIEYCNWAIGIIEANGLTIGRFNQILSAQSDPTLAQRILCIQNPGNAGCSP